MWGFQWAAMGIRWFLCELPHRMRLRPQYLYISGLGGEAATQFIHRCKHRLHSIISRAKTPVFCCAELCPRWTLWLHNSNLNLIELEVLLFPKVNFTRGDVSKSTSNLTILLPVVCRSGCAVFPRCTASDSTHVLDWLYWTLMLCVDNVVQCGLRPLPPIPLYLFLFSATHCLQLNSLPKHTQCCFYLYFWFCSVDSLVPLSSVYTLMLLFLCRPCPLYTALHAAHWLCFVVNSDLALRLLLCDHLVGNSEPIFSCSARDPCSNSPHSTISTLSLS